MCWVRPHFFHNLFFLKKETWLCGGKESCGVLWTVPHAGTSPFGLEIVSAGQSQTPTLWLASPRIKTSIYARFSRGESVQKAEFSVCAPQDGNICDICACPHSVSAASFLIKNCSNQPRGLFCEVEEPKLFVNSVQIQWIFFSHPKNVSFLHFATKRFHFVTNLISFVECEMVILFCCKDYSWVDPSH